ncbi:MAG: hypothetical protein U0939_24760 [Pirellulales bacterium]
MFAITDGRAADDPVFSGPQVGEKLPPFRVRGVFDDDAGMELDFVKRADGKPLVLIFVHDVNRQSISMTRVLSQYTHSRAAEGLATGIVWLDDDATAAETMLNRIKHALTPQAPVGISLDGVEGPGSYGLNRKVMLTILVAKDNRVAANFALIQPSLQVDLPKILAAVVAVAGGKAPSLDELPEMRGRMESPAKGAAEPPNLRPLLAPLIKRGASDDEVAAAARAIDQRIADDPAARRELGRIVHTIIDAGKLANYGTPKAQEHLRRWSQEIAPPQRPDGAPREEPKPKEAQP